MFSFWKASLTIRMRFKCYTFRHLLIHYRYIHISTTIWTWRSLYITWNVCCLFCWQACILFSHIELVYLIYLSEWHWIPETLRTDKEETWNDRDVILQTEAEDTMEWTREDRIRFKWNGNKKETFGISEKDYEVKQLGKFDTRMAYWRKENDRKNSE